MNLTTEFAAFWKSYPRRVGKLAAQKAYAKARTQASAEEILAGVIEYIVHKPAYADWCHAKTWLSQGRWLDEYGPVEPPAIDWWDECKLLHGGACDERLRHHHRMLIDAEKAR